MCSHNNHNRGSRILTHIDEAAGAALAELPGLVGEADLDNAGDVTGRGLDPDGVTRDQLGPDRDCAEDDLDPVKEVLPDDDDGLPSRRPSLTGGDGLDLGDEGGHGVEAGVGAVQSADLAAVLGVVVDEHVLREAEQGGGVHHEPGRDGDLEPPHVPGISRILEAILIALEEKLELEPGKGDLRESEYNAFRLKFSFKLVYSTKSSFNI